MRPVPGPKRLIPGPATFFVKHTPLTMQKNSAFLLLAVLVGFTACKGHEKKILVYANSEIQVDNTKTHITVSDGSPHHEQELDFTGGDPVTLACDGCPASALTFHAGVKKAVEDACPEITEILQVKGMGGGGKHAAPLLRCQSGGKPRRAGCGAPPRTQIDI